MVRGIAIPEGSDGIRFLPVDATLGAARAEIESLVAARPAAANMALHARTDQDHIDFYPVESIAAETALEDLPWRSGEQERARRHTAGEGTASLVTPDVYLDYLTGERVGPSREPSSPTAPVREWTPSRIGTGITQHGTTRFHAVDALVRTHLTGPNQHPIARLAA